MTKNDLTSPESQSQLSARSDLHLLRKIWHLSMGTLIALIYWFTGMRNETAILILGSILALDLVVETLRLKSPSVNQAIMRMWGPFMRVSEAQSLSGIPYYLAATILAVGLFPKTVAVLSILYLAWGDPIASIFGIRYGKKHLRLANGKSLVGTLAGVLACFAVSLVFLRSQPIPFDQVLILSVAGGIAGGMAEWVPFELDDNFTIPVISGFVLWLSFILLGV